MAGQKDQISLRILARMLIVVILISFLPVLVAGRYDWWEGWVFGITSLGIYVVGRGLLLFRSPELVADRARFSLHEGVRRWDRILAPLMASGSFLISLTAATDIRFSWSPGFGLPVQLIALFVVLAGGAAGTWAMLENPFFAAMVRIQTDRGHQVISDGPYRLVRHPGYAGTMWFFLAMPFFLDSDWALLPAACMIIVGITRTALEDRTLLEGLPGYRDYARRVRFRLVPGLW
jgi:protein-S-isoprenylcysteine O-methyltransferase Ste14